MKYKKAIGILILLVLTLTFFGCQNTDLVAKVAVSSFDALTNAVPDRVQSDDRDKAWDVSGLDGKERLILSKDFEYNPDIALEFDAKPFIDAGLDVSKLPQGQYSYDKASGRITMPFEYGGEKFDESSEKSALDAFKEIVKTHREIIGYHEEGDHYMISLGNGNTFAWAKDISSNKTDLGFILNPKPFIEAGVDTGRLKEWKFAKMPVTDKDGKQVLLDKFIKGFNVK